MGAGINCLFNLENLSIAVTTVVSFPIDLFGGLLASLAEMDSSEEEWIWVGMGIGNMRMLILMGYNVIVHPTNRMAPRQRLGFDNARLGI